MKYFTKEFYRQLRLSYLYSCVRKSILAESKDEDFYRKKYAKACALFLRREKMCDCYVDPIKELQRVEDFVNEENISEEERKMRALYKDAYIHTNRDRIESGKFFKFDKALCERKFAERQRARIELLSDLPKYISDKIADLRVLALGYASEEVKNLLRPYCKKLKNEVDCIFKIAYEETANAEKHLTKVIGFNEFQEINILSIEEKCNDIIINLECGSLLIKDGKITKGQCKPVYPYNREKPNCPWSRILATELHFSKNIFELNFLISNLDEIEKEELWEIDITGTDILKTV